jgi:hypothetical protein
MTGAVMAEDASWSARLFSWCGIALIAAAVLMVVATVLHPSRETATTIVASEPRLVAAHVAYTFAWLLILLGLPGFYAAQRGGMGRLGLVGFLTAFSGTLPHCGDGELRISRPGFGQAVSGGARFDQPIRAGGAHQWVGSDLVHDRLCAVRRRHDQDFDNASLVRCPSSGGRSRSFTWFRYSTACHDCRLADRDSRQRVSRRRARLGGLSAPAHTDRFGRGCFRAENGSMSTGSAERPVTKPRGTAHRVRVIIFRIAATLAGLFFVVAVVLMASAPWVLAAARSRRPYRTESLVPHCCRQCGRDHRGCPARPRTTAAPDTVGRRPGRCGDCGRRDHPSLPALVRRHPRNWGGAADRLPVLA